MQMSRQYREVNRSSSPNGAVDSSHPTQQRKSDSVVSSLQGACNDIVNVATRLTKHKTYQSQHSRMELAILCKADTIRRSQACVSQEFGIRDLQLAQCDLVIHENHR